MSSTLSRPAPSPTEIAAAPTVAEAEEDDFAGFARAVGIGTAIGIPTFAVIVMAMMRIAAPDISLATAAPVIIWTAIWTGVFLGGTVTVGLWAHRQEH